MRVGGGDRHRHHPAERQADEVGTADAGTVESGEDVGAEPGDRLRPPRRWAGAVPGMVDEHATVSGGEGGDLAIPHRRRAAQRPEPDDGRTVDAGVDHGKFSHLLHSVSAVFRLAAMRSVSTTMRSRLVASQSADEPPARSSALSAGHSACHAPDARSKS